MAQGTIKKKAKPADTRRPSVLGPKKGARAIAPKKAGLVRQRGITKKLSAGLTAKTERNLAEKAGHLELLAGGKKGSKNEKSEKVRGKPKAKEHFKGKSNGKKVSEVKV